MALPLPTGLTPAEIAFQCELEMVTVVPRQRLESLELLAGPTPPLVPPRRTTLPLWLALLLHTQRRCTILPPPWLSVGSLTSILEAETNNPSTFSAPPPWVPYPYSHHARKFVNTTTLDDDFDAGIVAPPFQESATADAYPRALPYHYHELSTLILAASPSSLPDSDANAIRGLLRDIREVRASKLRAGMKGLEGGGVVSLRGVGAMEVWTERAFVAGVIDGLRILGKSREEARREGEGEDGNSDRNSAGDEGSDDEI